MPMSKNNKFLTFFKKHFTFYNVEFLLVSIFIIMLSVFFSLNTKAGIPPDERSHFNLITRYYESHLFSIDSPYIEHNLTSSPREPSLYHASLGKLFKLIKIEPNIARLRIVNLGLLVLFLLGVYLFLKELSATGFSYHIFMVLLLNSTMLPFLFASVNYDNLVNVSSIFLTLFFLRLWKKLSDKNLLFYMFFLIVGSMTKISFLPLAFIYTIILFIHYRNNFKEILVIIKSNKLILVVLTICIALFSYFWFYNLVVYRNLSPSCIQEYSHDECMKNSIYERGQKLHLNDPLKSSPATIDNYFNSWKNGMISGIFGIFSHDSTTTSADFSVIMFYFFALGIILSIVRNKNDRFKNSMLLGALLIYSAFVFHATYGGYLRTGLLGIARQGRYLFPILPLVFYLVSSGYSSLNLNRFTKLIVIVVLLLFINQNSLRYVMHNNLLKSENYFQVAQHKKLVETIDRKVPLVGSMLFWK